MAKQITELTLAGAITKASDLLWLEQGGVPRKVSILTLEAALTPGSHNHDAADVTAGVFADARIPSLATSKITSGVFADARIPSLDTSKITTGTFANARIAVGNVTQHQAALSIGLNQLSGGDIPSGQDLSWLNADQPWISLDSSSAGDNWTSQGAGISVGESGKKGSAAIHITYRGDGIGYIGMGAVDDTAGTGGRPGFSHFEFHYNTNQISVGGRLYPGANDNTTQTVGYIEDVDGNSNYGTINVLGARGSSGTYSGYSIGGRTVFMDDGVSVSGLYNDVNNEWFLRAITNGEVSLYYNGVIALRTSNRNGSDIGMGAQIQDGGGSFRPVGMNIMPIINKNLAYTFALVDNGKRIHHTSGTAHTWTVPNDAAIPVGATITLTNQSSGDVTIARATSVVLNWYDGSGVPVNANRTLSAGGVATLHKASGDLIWYIWGNAGLT